MIVGDSLAFMAPDTLSLVRPRGTSEVAVSRCGTLVTVGTSTKYPFPRLLRAVIDVLHRLPAPVTLQYDGPPGSLPNDPLPPGIERVGMLTRPAFLNLLRRSALVITHAGAGTLLEAMRVGIPVIAMPRRPELGEVADGHQLELVDVLRGTGAVQIVEDGQGLRDAVSALDLANPTPRRTWDLMNPDAVVCRVRSLIDDALQSGARPRIALVATSGGHMTELRQLADAYRHYPHFYIESQWQSSRSNDETTYVFPSSERDWRVILHAGSIAWTLALERPGIVLTTGSGSSLPVLAIARTLGAQVIYVESVTRVAYPSLAARLAAPFCDAMLVRWPALLKAMPTAELIPALRNDG